LQSSRKRFGLEHREGDLCWSRSESEGIGGSVLRWIESWLCGRKQRVMLGGQVSDWSEVLSGVPQGSLLGPILFVLPYILVILMSNSEVLIWQVIT